MLAPIKTYRDSEKTAYTDFLNNYSEYRRTHIFDKLRQREFSRLDKQQHVYLDYAGGSLYPLCLVKRHAEMLEHAVLGNPHSKNSASHGSTLLAAQARQDVLRYFNANPDEYRVIFTANASAALKLVGESYPFCQQSHYLLTADNHNSVHGIREFARRRGATITYIPPDSNDLRSHEIESFFEKKQPSTASLFAYPAQSNYSGVQHPLSWIELAHAHGYHVLLDAAAFVPSNRLDLSTVHADFISLSFYKMFGYPTGVGALIARKSALTKLQRPWFAGGTVQLVSIGADLYVSDKGEAAFEEGTINYLDLAAISTGLSLLQEHDTGILHDRLKILTAYLLKEMCALQHSNGKPLIQLYGPSGIEQRGSTIAFNVLDPEGGFIPYHQTEKQANDANISIRSGCFCNPGAGEFSLQHDRHQIRACYNEASSSGDFNMQRYQLCLGDRASGAVRISLGLASNFSDSHHFIKFLVSHYTDQTA